MPSTCVRFFLCLLHIGQSDASIGLRHSRRLRHPTLRLDPIHICQMARNAYIRICWYSEGVLFITTPSERQLHCTRCSSRSADDLPRASQLVPDSQCQVENPCTLGGPTASGPNQGIGSANVQGDVHKLLNILLQANSVNLLTAPLTTQKHM